MGRTQEALRVTLDAKGAAGVDNAINVADYRHVVFQVGSSGNMNATVKFQGSVSKTAPDFSAAQSVSNHWDYIETIDLEDGASIAGDTGLAFAGADDFRLLAANVDNLEWISARITTWTAGNLTVNVAPATND